MRILSKRFSPLGMEAALNEFLATQRSLLQSELSDEVVKSRCSAIIQSLEDPPTTYSEEASDFWDSIVHGMPFDWTAQVIAELKLLTATEVLASADTWLFSPSTRRSVSMMVFSADKEAERIQLKDRIARGESADVITSTVNASAPTTTTTTTVTATHTSTTISALSGEVEVEMKEQTMLEGGSTTPLAGQLGSGVSDTKVSYIFSIDDLPTLRDSLPLGPDGRR